MNILLVFVSEGGTPPIQFALMPSELLSQYNLDVLNGQEVQAADTPDPAREQITELFYRCGCETPSYKSTGSDLEQYRFQIGKEPSPMTVDKVIVLRWAV